MTDDVVARVLAVVTRLDAKGQALYVNAEIRHVIPLVILEVGMDVSALPEKLRVILDETAHNAGIKPGMSADEVTAAFRAFYERFPPNAQLIADIAGVLRETVTGGAGPTGAMAAVLGQDKVSGVLGGGARPPGTLPGGMAALIAARVTPKKKP